MANLSLQRFEDNGIELFIDTTTGESFATVSGYARMSGKDKGTISRRLKPLHGELTKEAQIQTTTGSKTVALVDGKLACQWLVRDNPALLAAMAEAGWNLYCHRIVGFDLQQSSYIQLLHDLSREVSRLSGEILDLREELEAHKQDRAEIERLVKDTDEWSLQKMKEIYDRYETVEEGNEAYFSKPIPQSRYGINFNLMKFALRNNSAVEGLKRKRFLPS